MYTHKKIQEDINSINRLKYHYLYKITNIITGEYYIGIHSTNDLDDGYFGSGRLLKNLIREFGKDQFKKEILKFCKDRLELLDCEEQYVNENTLNDKKCLNLICGGLGASYYSTKGTTTVRNPKTGKCFNVKIDDPRLKTGELIHSTKGKVTVFDSKSNKFISISTDDPRYISGELKMKLSKKFSGKGRTMIYNRTTNEYKCIYAKELNEYLKKGWIKQSKCKGRVSPTKGMVWVCKGDEMKIIKKEELQVYLNDGWVNKRNVSPCKNKIGIIKDGINKFVNEEELQVYLNDGWVEGMSTRNKGMVTVYDPLKPNEKCFSVTKDDPRFISGELKLAVFKKYNMGLGGSCKGLKYINKDGVIKRVKPEELQSYLNDGWSLGMKK